MGNVNAHTVVGEPGQLMAWPTNAKPGAGILSFLTRCGWRGFGWIAARRLHFRERLAIVVRLRHVLSDRSLAGSFFDLRSAH
jgi:hypothetical protein